MGADQEGARIITAQSKAKENHYKLYHRWASKRTIQTVQLNQQGLSLFDRCVCPLHAHCTSVLGVSCAFKCNTQGQMYWAALQAVQSAPEHSVLLEISAQL